MSKKQRMDLNNRNTQLIIAGMTGFINEGLSHHEVFEMLDDIKSQTFPALSQLHYEKVHGGAQ